MFRKWFGVVARFTISFSFQVISFQEPVTLDFLDAELEDETKEEVSSTLETESILI